MTERALILGAGGFIGRHLAARLAAEGMIVTGIGHGEWTRSEWSRHGLSAFHAANISLDALLTCGGQPDLIFHCAGSPSVGFSIEHPYQDYQRTVRTSVDLLEYARVRVPGARLVFVSSAAVYGASSSFPTPESAPIEPVSPYGVHKRLAEQLFAASAAHQGLRTVALRLFSIYGPGLRKQLLWDACRKLSAGETSFAGSGQEQRDWLHVSDAVELMRVAATHASPECPIVNGGTGSSTSVADVLELLRQTFPGTPPLRFSGDRRTGDPDRLQADIARARAWGWQPRTTLEHGVARYAAWFRAGAS